MRNLNRLLTWIRINFKFLCFTFLAVSLVSISFYFHYSKIINVKNQTIINLERKVDKLTFLCSERNVYNLIENNTKLRNQVIKLNNTIHSLIKEKENLIKENKFLQDRLIKCEKETQNLKQQISKLKKQLKLFMIKVTGHVNVTGLNPWDIPVYIVFKSGGTKHLALLTNGRLLTYEIKLQNHQKYLVSVQCKNIYTQYYWETEPVEWALDENQRESIQKNWNFSIP